MNLGIAGKVGIVTGAGQGIGKAVALALSSEGVDLVINDINEELGNKTCQEIIELTGRKVYLAVGDISSEDIVESVIKKTINKLGKIDILINNAGISPKLPYYEISAADFQQVMAINLLSTFMCSKAVIESMKNNGWGRIVNMSSFAGRYGGVNAAAHYASSKAGIIGLTMTLARQLGSHNITVNCVAPGRIDTIMTKALPEEKKQEALSRIPLKRFGTPEEVASVIVFLASNEASYITGSCIDIMGGYLG